MNEMKNNVVLRKLPPALTKEYALQCFFEKKANYAKTNRLSNPDDLRQLIRVYNEYSYDGVMYRVGDLVRFEHQEYSKQYDPQINSMTGIIVAVLNQVMGLSYGPIKIYSPDLEEFSNFHNNIIALRPGAITLI